MFLALLGMPCFAFPHPCHALTWLVTSVECLNGAMFPQRPFGAEQPTTRRLLLRIME